MRFLEKGENESPLEFQERREDFDWAIAVLAPFVLAGVVFLCWLLGKWIWR